MKTITTLFPYKRWQLSYLKARAETVGAFWKRWASESGLEVELEEAEE